jgi:hypothetical protein
VCAIWSQTRLTCKSHLRATTYCGGILKVAASASQAKHCIRCCIQYYRTHLRISCLITGRVTQLTSELPRSAFRYPYNTRLLTTKTPTFVPFPPLRSSLLSRQFPEHLPSTNTTTMASLGEDLLHVVNKLQDLVFNTIGNDSLDLPQIVWTPFEHPLLNLQANTNYRSSLDLNRPESPQSSKT